MFIYKEDFNKFAEALVETVNYVKTDLMPDFDFDAFNHADDQEQYEQNKAETTTPDVANIIEADVQVASVQEAPISAAGINDSTDVDAWKI